MTPFERKVLTVVSRIPVGRVTTYGDVARLAGRPGAARAVGNIMQQATRPGLPYHRVIGAGGQIKLKFEAGLEQRTRLEMEGVRFIGKRVDLTSHQHRFRPWEFYE